ncbi:MAG: DUF1292 domain-containing protein [Bacillota bacterium]|nr:DUF1292 domain-containing protein [Bacillota bacterium]
MEDREEIITLIDDDGGKVDFVVLDYFKVGELDYAILLPFQEEEFGNDGGTEDYSFKDLDDEEDDDEEDDDEMMDMDDPNGDAVIFRVIKGNNGETMLHVIEDDDEWDRVAEIAYERLLAEEGSELEE